MSILTGLFTLLKEKHFLAITFSRSHRYLVHDSHTVCDKIWVFQEKGHTARCISRRTAEQAGELRGRILAEISCHWWERPRHTRNLRERPGSLTTFIFLLSYLFAFILEITNPTDIYMTGISQCIFYDVKSFTLEIIIQYFQHLKKWLFRSMVCGKQ